MYTVSKERFEKFVDVYCAMVTKNYGNKYYFNSSYQQSYFKHQGSRYFIDIVTYLDENIFVRWLRDGKLCREDGLASQVWKQTENGLFTLNKIDSRYYVDDVIWLSLDDYFRYTSYVVLNIEPYNIICDKYKLLTSDEICEYIAVKQEIVDFGEFTEEIYITDDR